MVLLWTKYTPLNPLVESSDVMLFGVRALAVRLGLLW